MTSNGLPKIIQGGMGVAISDWRLARAVSMEGQLGVVSGTALDLVLARRLQQGDLDGVLRGALRMFPYAEMVEKILERYFIPGGKSPDDAFISIPMMGTKPRQDQLELMVVANFVEVHLAKEGHDGLVGINYLEKIQPPTIPSIFGAMLAGVDYVLMGAGIPRHIPEILDQLSEGMPAELELNVEGADPGEKFALRFDPNEFTHGRIPWLARPKFIAIVASTTLGIMLAKKSKGSVDGFVIEGFTAGGHNAPPRGAMQKNERGEPVYGDRDVVDLKVFRKLGRPFWLAGSYGAPGRLLDALETGAAGVQVGTAFAFCDESGMSDAIKRDVMKKARVGETDVFTDPVASPTGFPFKVLQMEGTMSELPLYQERKRICDLGYLRHGYKKSDGTLGWRCPAEPVDNYLKKEGRKEDTVGRKCVCNGLMANIEMAQVRKTTGAEDILVTCGNEVHGIANFLPEPDATHYSAKHVIDYLLSAKPATQASEHDSSTVQLAGHS